MPFPLSRARVAVGKLFAVLVALGYSSGDLVALATKHARRYQQVYLHGFRDALLRALRQERERCLKALQEIVGQALSS